MESYEFEIDLASLITHCVKCGSKEIDVVVGHDTECRDCGHILNNATAAECCQSQNLGVDVLVIADKGYLEDEDIEVVIGE